MFVCNLAAVACIPFELWHVKVVHFLIILCVTLWAPQPLAPQPPTPPGHTCILCTVTYDRGFGTNWYQSQCTRLSRSKMSNTWQKVNNETTPPYLRDQFMTCNLKQIINCQQKVSVPWYSSGHGYTSIQCRASLALAQ